MLRRRRFVPGRAIRRRNRLRPPSKLELLVYGWLEADGISFEREKPIGLCHVDVFLPPHTAVEINGCYFHKHDCSERKRKKGDIRKIRKDARRIRFLESQGYEVIVIWECELKNEKKIRRLLRALAKGKACTTAIKKTVSPASKD